MEQFWKKFKSILKKEKVFVVSLIFAVITSVMSLPKLNYINFEVVILMFNLMIVIKAFENLRLLDKIAVGILVKQKNIRMVSLMLIFLCFFSSMIITNDVALITFVPLTMIIAKKAEINPLKIIIMETLAVNIGSSFTPIGNPQNLYLFSFFNIRVLDFFKITIFLAVIGLLWLFILNYRILNKNFNSDLNKVQIENKGELAIFFGLFVVILLSVFNVVDYRFTFVITLIITFIVEKKLFKEVEYFLLITFTCFFIAIGNISNIAIIDEFARKILTNISNVYFSSIFLSQIISNLPCAILLSKFTSSWKEILIGVNIGGMGTMIASLASLISYKFYSKEYDGKQYFFEFTIYNFVSLTVFTFICYEFLMIYK